MSDRKCYCGMDAEVSHVHYSGQGPHTTPPNEGPHHFCEQQAATLTARIAVLEAERDEAMAVADEFIEYMAEVCDAIGENCYVWDAKDRITAASTERDRLRAALEGVPCWCPRPGPEVYHEPECKAVRDALSPTQSAEGGEG